MKKVYPKPVTRVIELELCGMLAQSKSVEGNANMRWSKSGFDANEEDR